MGIRLRFPNVKDIESILPHDARGVVAKARVERGFVMLEDLVDAELMNHSPLTLTTNNRRSNAPATRLAISARLRWAPLSSIALR